MNNKNMALPAIFRIIYLSQSSGYISMSSRYDGIKVGGTSAAFAVDVNEALDKIASGPSGRKLLGNIAGLSKRSEKIVTIVEPEVGRSNVATPRLTAAQIQKIRSPSLTQVQFNQAIMKNAAGSTILKKRGTSSEIPWSKQTAEPRLNSDGRPIEGADPENAHIVLAHELIHAKHHLNGTMKYAEGGLTADASSAGTPQGKEELRAVGLGKYANRDAPTENSIRREQGLPERKTYTRTGEW